MISELRFMKLKMKFDILTVTLLQYHDELFFTLILYSTIIKVIFPKIHFMSFINKLKSTFGKQKTINKGSYW